MNQPTWGQTPEDPYRQPPYTQPAAGQPQQGGGGPPQPFPWAQQPYSGAGGQGWGQQGGGWGQQNPQGPPAAGPPREGPGQWHLPPADQKAAAKRAKAAAKVRAKEDNLKRKQGQGAPQWGPAGNPQGPNDAQQAPFLGSFDPTAPPVTAKQKSSKKPVLFSVGAITVVAAVGLSIAGAAGAFTTTVLDTAAVESTITTIYNDSFQLKAASVSCPARQEAVANTSFTCAASIDGKRVTIPVTVTDNNGAFTVDAPTGG